MHAGLTRKRAIRAAADAGRRKRLIHPTLRQRMTKRTEQKHVQNDEVLTDLDHISDQDPRKVLAITNTSVPVTTIHV